MTRQVTDRLWSHATARAEFAMHGRRPDDQFPYARIAIPKRRPHVGEVLEWCRDTWGPSTILRPNPNGGPDLRRPGARWALVPVPSQTWRILWRGMFVFDMGDAAMLQLRFAIKWDAPGFARSFWNDQPGIRCSEIARCLLGLDDGDEP